jgi:UrcA family protein
MMNRLGIAASGAFGLALMGGMALAQSLEEVKVTAARTFATTVGHSGNTGAPIVDISLSYGVSYRGLDLSTRAGAAELERRVNDAARAACEEISLRHPQGEPNDAGCAKAAAADAMVRVRELEVAARKSPRM